MKTARILTLCFFAVSSAFAQSDRLALKSMHAKEFMAAGKFSEAASLYRELTHEVPNNPGLLLNLGMALQMAGDDRGAVPQLEAAVKLDPRLAPAWLFLGTARLRLGRTASAIDALKTVLRLQPDQQNARAMLADALLSMGRATDAAEQYRALSEQNPENPSAWYGLGRSYETLSVRAFGEVEKTGRESVFWLVLTAETKLREQQFSSAFYLYRLALKKAPEMAGLHAALADIYQQTEHPAWAALEEEKERQRPQSDCRVHRIECSFNAGQYRELIAAARETDSPESHYWTARAYNQLAVEAFTRLGELPPCSEQHQLKARIYGNQKRYSEAAKEWKSAAIYSPGDVEIQEQLGISLKFSQNFAEALPVFEELLKKRPASAELNYLVGDTLLDLQRPEDAIPFLERAIERDPKLLPAHKSLARAELATGNDAAAIPHLRRVLATDTDGSLHFQLARAYQAAGHPELAKPVLAEYQRIQQTAVADRQASQDELRITPP